MRIYNICLLTLFLIFPLGSAFGGESGPRIEFTEQSGHLGKMFSGNTSSFTFHFRNSGNQTLVIEEIKASCGCTQVTPSTRELPPGKTGEIIVVFDSHWFSGNVEKHVAVHTNDSRNPVVTLALSAEVDPVIEITPRDVDFGIIRISRTDAAQLSKLVVVEDLLHSGLEVESVNTNKPFLKGQVEEVKGDQTWIKVELIPGTYRGYFQGLVKISTSSKLYPTIYAIARGEVKD